MSFKTFQVFEKLTAQDVNTQLMRQSVMTFASATERDATLTSGIVLEGMIVYLQDVNVYYMNLNGTTTGWYPIAGQVPRLELVKNGSQALANATLVKVTGWTQTMVRGGFTVTSDSFYVPLAGYYDITLSCQFAVGSTAGARMIEFRRFNSSAVLQEAINSSSIPWSGTTSNHVQTLTNYGFNSGDYFEMHVYQTSGSAATIDAVSRTKVLARWVGL